MSAGSANRPASGQFSGCTFSMAEPDAPSGLDQQPKAADQEEASDTAAAARRPSGSEAALETSSGAIVAPSTTSEASEALGSAAGSASDQASSFQPQSLEAWASADPADQHPAPAVPEEAAKAPAPPQAVPADAAAPPPPAPSGQDGKSGECPAEQPASEQFPVQRSLPAPPLPPAASAPAPPTARVLGNVVIQTEEDARRALQVTDPLLYCGIVSHGASAA